MKKLVLFNGAPNSGKDVSAIMMQELFGEGSIYAFKDELYKATAEYFNMDVKEFTRIARDRILKEKKTRLLVHKKGQGLIQRIKEFLLGLFTFVGISPREAMIFVSEKIIKPKFGNDFFGTKLSETVDSCKDDYIFVPDSGFLEELKPLVDAGHEVSVIRIKREGCTFEGDSRSELTDEMLKPFGIVGIDLDNNGTLSDLKAKLCDIALNDVLLKGNKNT